MQFWGGVVDDGTALADDMAMFKLAAKPQKQADAVCQVWPENWPALQCWLACHRQWRTTFTGLRLLHVGLDYAAVGAWLRDQPYSKKQRQAIWQKLGVMENAALTILNGES